MQESFKRWFYVWVLVFAAMVITTTFYSCTEKYGWTTLHLVFATVAALCMWGAARNYDRLVREQNSSLKDDSVGGA